MIEKEDLKKEKDQYTTKIFWLCLNIIFIFLIPALLAVYLGKKLDVTFNDGEQKFVNFTLIASFIFSWVIVVFYYKKLSKTIREIDRKIKLEDSNNQSKN